VNNVKNLGLWIVIALLLVVLFNVFQSTAQRGVGPEIAYSDFRREVDAGNVKDVTIQMDRISGHRTNGDPFTTTAPYDPDLVKSLTEKVEGRDI